MKRIDLYKGFEGYEEYTFLTVDKNETVQFLISAWDGYVSEVFENPDLSGKGWKGFTYLYHESYDLDNHDISDPLAIESNEDFLEDLLYYKDQKRNEEAQVLYESLVEMTEEAIAKNYIIMVARD